MFSSTSHFRVFYQNQTSTRTYLSISETSSSCACCPLHSPPALWFGCVVGVNAVMFLSSLHRSVIVPPHKHFRTRSASRWMLSKCFCREPRGGQAPPGFYSFFRQVHGEDSEKRRSENLHCAVIEPPGYQHAELRACGFWDFQPSFCSSIRRRKRYLRYLLLWDPAGTCPLCSTL